MQDSRAGSGPGLLDLVLYLLGIAGAAAGITLVFLSMRAVMDVGGMCAEGGPYVIETTCPEGSTAALLLGILGGIASVFLAAWKGVAIGGGAASLVFLAWPALFGLLGFNFLQYGFDPPGDDPGWAWGWLVCGALFWGMAFGPLLLGGWAALGDMTRRSSPSRPGARADLPARAWPGEERPGSVLERRPDPVGIVQATGGVATEAPDGSLVDALERLAVLRDRGDLTADEYATAKGRLLGTEGPP